MVFDPPVATVHGIVIGTDPFPDHETYETYKVASYHGADLTPSETRAVLQHSQPTAW